VCVLLCVRARTCKRDRECPYYGVDLESVCVFVCASDSV
jgi:hypothetical protein